MCFLRSIPVFVLLALTDSSASERIATSTAIRELTDRAQVIVIGRASARQTVRIGRDLATLVSIAVTESLKGTPQAAMRVAVPGGIDRNLKVPIEMVYIGAPQITSREEVLLFLEQGDPRLGGAFVVVGRSEGKLSIVTDRKGQRRVGAKMAPLSKVRDEIRRSVRGSGW